MEQETKTVQEIENKGLMGELWLLIKRRKAWWLLPAVIVIFLGGLLIIFSQSSVLSPFIYALF